MGAEPTFFKFETIILGIKNQMTTEVCQFRIMIKILCKRTTKSLLCVKGCMWTISKRESLFVFLFISWNWLWKAKNI